MKENSVIDIISLQMLKTILKKGCTQLASTITASNSDANQCPCGQVSLTIKQKAQGNNWAIYTSLLLQLMERKLCSWMQANPGTTECSSTFSTSYKSARIEQTFGYRIMVGDSFSWLPLGRNMRFAGTFRHIKGWTHTNLKVITDLILIGFSMWKSFAALQKMMHWKLEIKMKYLINYIVQSKP